MSVLSREDFMSRIKEVIGEDTSDNALSFIEDMQDTFNDLETKSSGNNDKQWEEKMTDLDNQWRQKYKDRFFNTETTPSDVVEEQTNDVIGDSEEVSFNDLFEEREG